MSDAMRAAPDQDPKEDSFDTDGLPSDYDAVPEPDRARFAWHWLRHLQLQSEQHEERLHFLEDTLGVRLLADGVKPRRDQNGATDPDAT